MEKNTPTHKKRVKKKKRTINQCKKQQQLKGSKGFNSETDKSDNSDKNNYPNSKKSAVWFVKDIPQAEQCECRTLNVTKEILTPTKEIIKRCTQCLEKLELNFPNAIWKPAYPEMPNCESEDA